MADTLIARVSSRRLLTWLVVAVVIIAAVIVWLHERGGGTRYRTATATTGSVTQSLSSVGTVAAASSAVAAFPVAGTVAKVPVRLGQKVTTGQLLATLQTGSLQQQVDSAKNTLDTARQTMADASTAQSDVSTDAASTGGSTGSGTDLGADSISDTRLESPSSSPSPTPSGTTTRGGGGGGGKGGGSGSGGGGSGSGGSSATVTRLQRQVRAEQQQIDAELTTLRAALKTQQADCKAGSGSGSTSATSLSVDVAPVAGEVKGSVATPVGTTITLLDGSSTVETVTTTASPYSYDFTGLTGNAYTLQLTVPVSTITAACQQSLQSVLQQEQQVADDERSQQGYEAQLDTAIQQLESQHGGSGGQPSSGGTHPSGGSSTHSGTGRSGYPGTGASSSTGTTRGTGTGGSSSTSSVPSAAQLAADQAHIDADSASLTVAKQNLSAATLTSPIAGTVADIGLSAGQSVEAGSSSEAITVLGGGTPQVQTTVALSDLDEVKVGDPATVDVDGVTTPQTGHVARIGVLDTTTGSTTTYPVTIALTATSARLLDGIDASVTITVRTAHDVLTVPTSAVRSLGPFHTVEVLAGSKLSATPVQVGAVGPLRTQITAGLKAGQSVVLADLSEPLPSSSSTTTRFGGGLGGGLGGTGGGGFAQRVGVGG